MGNVTPGGAMTGGRPPIGIGGPFGKAEETVQAHVDLRGEWLVPIHNGTFDLAMHRWQDPFERVTGLALARGVRLSTPRMGERLDLAEPHRGERWWREVVESAQPRRTARRWFACRETGEAQQS